MKKTPLNPIGKKTLERQANLRKLVKPLQCQECGRISPLDPHHIKHRSLGGNETKTNIKWLCRECHQQEHP